MAKIYTGVKRVKIQVATGMDLTNATSYKLFIKKPDGHLSEWSASIFGAATGGVLIYYTVAGDLEEAGLYTGTAIIETSDGGKYLGETFTFKIFERFK